MLVMENMFFLPVTVIGNTGDGDVFFFSSDWMFFSHLSGEGC